jgi:hypothetical protein
MTQNTGRPNSDAERLRGHSQTQQQKKNRDRRDAARQSLKARLVAYLKKYRSQTWLASGDPTALRRGEDELHATECRSPTTRVGECGGGRYVAQYRFKKAKSFEELDRSQLIWFDGLQSDARASATN